MEEMDSNNSQRYAGFWLRVMASVIDTLLLGLITAPALHWIYGPQYWQDLAPPRSLPDILFNYIAPALIVILFWAYRSATPGKMVLGLVIVDAKTGGKPSFGQLCIRYLAYYLSALPMLLGFIWVGIDARKRGWHDMIAGTLVLRKD